MTMKQFGRVSRLIGAVSIALCAVSLSACKFEPKDKPGTKNVAASQAVTLVNAALGANLLSTELKSPETSFTTKDSISAIVVLEGGSPSPVAIEVDVSDSTGKPVVRGDESVSVSARSAFKVDLVKQPGSIPPGDYTALVKTDGKPGWELKFNVKE